MNDKNEQVNKEQFLLEYVLNRRLITPDIHHMVYEEYKEKVKSLYGDRIHEYDKRVRWSLFGFKAEDSSPQALAIVSGQKKDTERLDPKRHFMVDAFPYPFICSPTFAVALGKQLLAQMEKVLGVPKFSTLSRTEFCIEPFRFSCKWFGNPDPSLQKITVMENGVCYTYFQCRIIVLHPAVGDQGDKSELLWVRYHSLVHPSEEIPPECDVVDDDILFELCLETPKAFPSWEDLPPTVHQFYEIIAPHSPVLRRQIERMYDATGWIAPFKANLDKVIEYNRRAAEKAAERRARKKKEKDRQIFVEMAEQVYYPDVVFALNFESKLTKKNIQAVEKIMTMYDKSLDSGLEFWLVQMIDENCCEISVDFGPNDPKVIDELIDLLRKSDLDIESIMIS